MSSNSVPVLLRDVDKQDTEKVIHVLPIVIAAAVIVGAIKWLTKKTIPTLWISSPSGKTMREFPVYQALRIIRKQGWKLVKVAPIRHIGRWEALRILFKGDNNGS